MSDFSTFAIFTAGLAAFAPLVSASIDVRGGSNPTGPAVLQPGYGSIVPAGKQFAITWESKDSQDCGSTVDLVLLHGPSASQMVAQNYIAQGTENNGTYLWTPSNSLQPTSGDTGYGIELLCSKSNAYQYTTQFGISNDNYVPSSSSSSSSSASAGPSGYANANPYTSGSASASANASASVTQMPVYTTEVVTSYTTYCPYATTLAVNNKTYTVTEPTTLTITNCPCTITKPISAYGSSAPYPAGNGTQSHATGTVSVSSSLKTSTSAAVVASSSSPTTATASSSRSAAPVATQSASGASSQFGASLGGLVIAAGVAVFAL